MFIRNNSSSETAISYKKLGCQKMIYLSAENLTDLIVP